MKYNLRMKKQFVKYEAVVELKKLGFDEPCLGRWLVVTKWEKPTGEIILQLGTRAEDFDKNQFPAPTFSQAFRFFREKYNMLANVYSNASGFCYEYSDTIGGTHRFDSGFDGPNDSGCWNSYEDAEIACLQKMIEIVENI